MVSCLQGSQMWKQASHRNGHKPTQQSFSNGVISQRLKIATCCDSYSSKTSQWIVRHHQSLVCRSRVRVKNWHQKQGNHEFPSKTERCLSTVHLISRSYVFHLFPHLKGFWVSFLCPKVERFDSSCKERSHFRVIELQGPDQILKLLLSVGTIYEWRYPHAGGFNIPLCKRWIYF